MPKEFFINLLLSRVSRSFPIFSFFILAFHLESETGQPLITKDLETMVNQSKNFPSFNDVLDTVEKANDKYKLHLK
jgi:hypothetical protein